MCMTEFAPATVAEAVSAQTGLAAGLFDVLRADSLDDPGVTRDPYGPGEQRAHATLTETARRMGLHIEHDHAANTYMTLPGRDRSLPRVIVGSHLDSVPHGGNFDGAAGVIAGIVAVAALQQLGIAPACDLTVMAIRAEESVWFQVSYIGSRGALGTLPDGALEVRRRDTGRTLAEHIGDCGGDPGALAAGKRFLDPAAIRCYLEVHIEQAPSLVEAGRAVALCTGIPGTVRYPDAWIEGQADHVGTPRRFRRDAALAGADFAVALDALWEEREAAGVPMAWTLGKFHTDTANHGLTIVPGEFRFSLDVRAYDEATLADLDQRVDAIIAGIEQRRGVKFHRGVKAGAKVGPVDPAITSAMEAGAAALRIPVLHIGSPASHDGAAFAAEGVPMAMLFVRNENGSHNPREAMEVGDFMEACKVLTLWLVENVR
jgi:N-carbamoyl-L-amino-acid hydrolase